MIELLSHYNYPHILPVSVSDAFFVNNYKYYFFNSITLFPLANIVKNVYDYICYNYYYYLLL